MPPELDLSRFNEDVKGAALTLVVGDNDEYFTEKVISREAERLVAGGLRYRLQRYQGTHVIEADALLELAASFR